MHAATQLFRIMRCQMPSGIMTFNLRINVIGLAVWRSGSAFVLINEVNVRRVRLLLGWVTMSGFDSRGRHFISVCKQSPRSTQLSTLRGTVKWVPAKWRWRSAAAGSTGRLVCRLNCVLPYLSALENAFRISLYKLPNVQVYFTLLY